MVIADISEVFQEYDLFTKICGKIVWYVLFKKIR